MFHAARGSVVALMFLVAAAPTTSTTAPSTQPAASIGWADAAKHVGETVTVTGPVMGTHPISATAVVLNIGKDYPDKSRFTVLMPFSEAAGSADDQFIGRTISATGKVKIYKGIPEISTRKASDVLIQK